MKKMMFATILWVGSLVSACNDKGLLQPELDPNSYQIINGDTVKVRSDQTLGDFGKNTFSHDLRIFYGDTIVLYKKYTVSGNSTKKPDLSKIKNISEPNKPFRMIAVGGAVAAGVRDGGYFNEGLETSFPNLIANQTITTDAVEIEISISSSGRVLKQDSCIFQTKLRRSPSK